MRIALHKPFWDVKEFKALQHVLVEKKTGRMGEARNKLIGLAKETLKIDHVVPVSSCTAALEVALQSIPIQAGDEVICPSFTFVSTANAIIRQQAKPIFIDIERKTLNINAHLIEKAITPKTKAIIVVHYAGLACHMKKILSIAKQYRLWVVEDAAHAFGSTYGHHYLGTLGDIGCFSFNETKNLVSDKGGLVISKHKKIIDKAEIIVENGTNKMAFLRNEVKGYEWIESGSNYVLPDILASLALEQVKKMPLIIKKRKWVAQKLHEGLIPMHSKLELPNLIDRQGSNWHIFPILVDASKRDAILSYLRKKGIEAAFHYIPLHLSTFAKKYLNYKSGDFPVTERVAQSLIRLPIYPQMTLTEIQWITRHVKKAAQQFL